MTVRVFALVNDVAYNTPDAILSGDALNTLFGVNTNVGYALTLVVMLPFMVTTPFTGFAATALGGVDISIFIGLPLAGVLYLFFCRSLDLAAERRVVAEEGILTGVH